jgi:AraC-like DNA-binding protein/TolB-like protein/tetratricopeptide (TPR) repeat protein
MDGFVHDQPIDDTIQGLLPQHVKRALAYMRGNLAEKITLAELTSACATTERTLLKQFRKFVGLSPLAFLRRLRLNAARSELQRSTCDTAVSEVAAGCGFTHLGRFATEYRRAFGETPSMTRQRVRGDGPDCAPPAAPVVWCEKPTLLVMPLRTETLQEQFEARDLSERLGATLSCMRIATVTLVHPSRAPSFNAKRPFSAKRPVSAGRQQDGGTQYALMGCLRRVDDCTRVIVRLVDVDADRHLWGDSFDGSASDPFGLQDRVVDGVLCGVVSSITDAELGRVQHKDPRDRAARDLATQALPLILAARLPSTLKAMTLLERAIELDPSEPLAVALLACCHGQVALNFGTSSPPAARAEMDRLARRAALLDSSDPLVTTARAMAMSMSWQCEEGHSLAVRAVAMDPTSTWAWERRGFTGLCRREHPDRLIGEYTRALQLRGPDWPHVISFMGMASAHRSAGRLREAEVWARKALAENPDMASTHRWEAQYAFDIGDLARMAQAVERMRRLHPDASVSLLMACAPGADPRWLDAMAGAGLPL